MPRVLGTTLLMMLLLAPGLTARAASLPFPIDLGGLNGANGATFIGAALGNYTGEMTTEVGDLNGDGISDFAISERYAAPGGKVQAGRVSILWGKPTPYGSNGVQPLAQLTPADGRVLEGGQPLQNLGLVIAPLGDVNGDGLDDLLITAPGYGSSSPGVNDGPGAGYVIYGPLNDLDFVTDIDTLVPDRATRIVGAAASDYLGVGGWGAGDFDGDGLNDVILSTAFHAGNGLADAGGTWLIYGREGTLSESGSIVVTELDGATGMYIPGLAATDNTGRVAHGVGDINGDGYDDFTTGGWNVDRPGRNDVGAVYLIYGGPRETAGGSPLDLAALDGTRGVKILGVDAADQFSRTQGPAGDFNGDGFMDLLAGARAADGPSNTRELSGDGYLIYGRRSPLGSGGLLDLESMPPSAGTTIHSPFVNGLGNFYLTSVGDVNGDGLHDFMSGAPLATVDSRISCGVVYLVYGNADGLGANGTFELFTINGPNGTGFVGATSEDLAGACVNPAGDLNLDGYADFLIGGTGFPGNTNKPGTVSLIYGGGTAKTATYSSWFKPGATGLRGVGLYGPTLPPSSRFWIQFADGAADGNQPSLATVELARGLLPISGFGPDEVARVRWTLSSTRSTRTLPFTIRVQYLPSEIGPLDPATLSLFRQTTANRWLRLETTRDTARRMLTAQTDSPGTFIIAREDLFERVRNSDLWQIH